MLFVVEVFAGDGERVEGTVQREDSGPPAAYCGWLELLRILEPAGRAEGFGEEAEQADVVQASLGEEGRQR